MHKQALRLRAAVLRFHQFSRRGDAVFRSLGREVIIVSLSVATLLSATAKAQTTSTSVPPQSGEETSEGLTLDDVEVTAARVAMPMLTAARPVTVITQAQIKDLPAQSVNDLLKYVATVDVRQRGAMGVQTDISIGGGTQDQILILINGVSVSSPHTGHFSAELPLSTADIERIEVLEGAASRVYGAGAFSGAINIVTRTSKPNSTPWSGTVSLEGGSFGTWGAEAGAQQNNSWGGQSISATHRESDGGTPHSDFQRTSIFYHGNASLRDADVQWQTGFIGKDYGANTFYSARYPDQHDATRHLFASVSATTHGQVAFTPTVYYSRLADNYQLIRHTTTGENYHLTNVYGLSLTAKVASVLGTSSVSADLRNEGILSTVLGRPLADDQLVRIPGHKRHYKCRDNRTIVNYFIEHNVVWRHFTVSAGLLANLSTSIDHRYRLYPGIDISYRPTTKLRLYGSWSTAQRLPTFTDLYYKSPTQEGNTALRPERVDELALGATYTTPFLNASLRLTHRNGRQMIDWVMTDADSTNDYTVYHASAFRLKNEGVSAEATLDFGALTHKQTVLRRLHVSYSYLHQRRRDSKAVVASCYALDYLRHKFVARLDLVPVRHLTATLTTRYQEREGRYIRYDSAGGHSVSYHPYALADLRLTWRAKRFSLYAEGDNLTAHRYVDIGNVEQPGFCLMAGATLHL